MHRTEGANNNSNLFTDGPPGTVLDANWCNAVQEEIANIIEGASIALLTAGTDTRAQLLTALQTLFQRAVFVNASDGGAHIDGTRFDLAANLVEDTWETIGPTTSGADNTWAPLDDVPSSADWIEVQIDLYGSGGSGTTTTAYGRAGDSTLTDVNTTKVAVMTGTADETKRMMCNIKLPLDANNMVSCKWVSNHSTDYIFLKLVGYGANSVF